MNRCVRLKKLIHSAYCHVFVSLAFASLFKNMYSVYIFIHSAANLSSYNFREVWESFTGRFHWSQRFHVFIFMLQCSSGGLLTLFSLNALNGSTVIRVRLNVRLLLRGSHSFSGPLVTTASFCDYLPWFPATAYWLKKWKDIMKEATVIVNFQGTYCCFGEFGCHWIYPLSHQFCLLSRKIFFINQSVSSG